jgi:hypothetical protein
MSNAEYKTMMILRSPRCSILTSLSITSITLAQVDDMVIRLSSATFKKKRKKIPTIEETQKVKSQGNQSTFNLRNN